MAPHGGMPQRHLPVVSYLALPVISRSGEVLADFFSATPKRTFSRNVQSGSPPAPAPEKEIGTIEPAPRKAHPRRILIIEDNQLAARNTAIFLTENGHTVEVASDGIKAIQAAQWFRPEIVLCDLGLPDLDGYGVAETFRRDPAFTNSMYLIAVTGYGQDEDKRRALDAGFNAHLTRPVDLTALEEMIASLHADAADIGENFIPANLDSSTQSFKSNQAVMDRKS